MCIGVCNAHQRGYVMSDADMAWLRFRYAIRHELQSMSMSDKWQEMKKNGSVQTRKIKLCNTQQGVKK